MLGPARGDLAEEDDDAFSYARVSFSSPGMPGILCRQCDVRHVFAQRRFSGRVSHAASLWLDLAEGRLRLDRLSRNGAGSTFFPWAMPIPREATKVSPAPSSAPQRHPSGCVVDRLRLSDRHRGRGGRGLETAKGEVTWRTSVPSRRSAVSCRARSSP